MVATYVTVAVVVLLCCVVIAQLDGGDEKFSINW